MKSIAQAVANLKSSLAVIPQRYKDAVSTADWQTNAASDASEQLWAAETAKAAAEKRRQKGILRVGNEKWRAAAINKGAVSIVNGITQGLGSYQTNFGQAYQAFQGFLGQLPPRSADGIQNVENRVKPVVAAWIKARVR